MPAMKTSRESSDEGEISDNEFSKLDKATKSLSKSLGSSVDRPDRSRSRHSDSRSTSSIDDATYTRSRARYSRDRSRSPYRAPPPGGTKRSRDDDHYARPHDSRKFKVHYEDREPVYKRQPRSYADIDAGTITLRDSRDNHFDKRARTRSRSPYRAPRVSNGNDSHSQHRKDEVNVRDSDGDRGYRHRERVDRSAKDQSVSNRAQIPLATDESRREAKHSQGYLQPFNGHIEHNDEQEKSAKRDGHQDNPEPEPQIELSEEAQIELRRQKRQALKAKFGRSGTPMLVQALHSANPPTTQVADKEDKSRDASRATTPSESAPGSPMEGINISSPGQLSITNDFDLANNKNNNTRDGNDSDGPSAADYDPTADMREGKHRGLVEISSSTYTETMQSVKQDVLLPASDVLDSAQVKKAKDEDDMFASDEDDMFAEESSKRAPTNHKLDEPFIAVPIPEGRTLDAGMLDNWDDAEGYYKIIIGELLDGRYHVQANLGGGMFSGVVRATDITTKQLVAIKLIRNNQTMRKAGYKEIEILERLQAADPEDKKHMIRLERSFEHKGHLCMVFENLSINLREVLKKFGRDIGINLKAVRAYATQMFLGLSLLRKCNILHADLKPDNILVNEGRNLLKICDLGSASDASDNEITPYLVSRFYRAPEIILGMEYDFAIDIWSIGCTLYEMYTGKILFAGRSNNQMLRSIMECRGPFTRKLLLKAQFAGLHFDEHMKFMSVEQDKSTGRDMVKLVTFIKPIRDLKTRLIGASKGLSEEEMKELSLFTDLLDKCLNLNPAKRITPIEALKHPFVSRPIALAPAAVRSTGK